MTVKGTGTYGRLLSGKTLFATNRGAPTGFDHDASAFELEFEGLALAA